jgi:threonyl-tRNA synthetase
MITCTLGLRQYFKSLGQARRVAARLRKAELRVEADFRSGKVDYTVREHSLAKVPAIAVVGRREAKEGALDPQRRKTPGET